MTDRTNKDDSAALNNVAGQRNVEGRAEPLTRSSDIFFAAVETTRMPMIVTDPNTPDNDIIFANRAFLTMTGYEAHEILGQNCRFLQGPETNSETIAEIRNAIAARTEIATEILNYRKNGSTFWNALFISPVYDPDGNLLYFFGSQLDISRRRDAEEALRQAQKMEALGQLTGGIAHDFNNLLQVMTGYQELNIQALERGKVNPDRLLRNVRHAHDAAKRAATLTQQLLAFARKQRLEGRALNLNERICGMEDMVRHSLGDGIKLHFEFDEGLWNCRIDASQYEVALLNIILNARDALQNVAHASVTLQTLNVTVERTAESKRDALAPGRYVRVSVVDNGVGMPLEIQDRVLDPFFTTKGEGRGTGLGLSMVYGFVKQSEGGMQIVSEPHKGTAIHLFFPAVEALPSSLKQTDRENADLQGHHETILIVEDRPDVADLAEAFLEDFGYRVQRAENADQALEILHRDTPIDLLFTDLVMPGTMNGVMLAREATRIRPMLKCLLTTGYAAHSLERTEAGGAEYDVIDKPYRKQDLGRKIRYILNSPGGAA
ncbi:histidine kinase famiy protein [Kozakia baliensis]|uniref:histidine kinase famiy protein n=1 Tax=Kozakia baliensis TaxID=153496 RepID=UPI0009DCB9B0|nr:histidine kinase famiy protein [Kozakia baliensis]